MTPLDLGTGALEDVRQGLSLLMELGLGLSAQLAKDATGLTPRGAKALGEFPQRLACSPRPRLGHAVERRRGKKLGVHGEGRGRCAAQLIDPVVAHTPSRR